MPESGKAKAMEMQRQALHLHLEGMRFRGIRRWLGVGHEVGSSMEKDHPAPEEDAKACESGKK